MIDLEPIPAEEEVTARRLHQSGDLETHGMVDIMADLTRFDAERLRQLIESHVHYTDSRRGRDILDNWQEMLPKFRKVMPVEYRRALAEMERAQVEEDDSPVAIAGE